MATRKQHNADLLIVLLLFFVYASCALLLCVLGANSYSQTVAVLQDGYDQRSGVLYVAQKVHQNDIGGGVRVEQYAGNDALVLVEQETGQAYETWLFIQDGYLCEEFIAAGSDIVEGQAQRIMPMQAMQLTLNDKNLLSVSLTTDTGKLNAISLALRSGGDTFNTGNNPPLSSKIPNDDPAASGPTIMTPAPNEGGAS